MVSYSVKMRSPFVPACAVGNVAAPVCCILDSGNWKWGEKGLSHFFNSSLSLSQAWSEFSTRNGFGTNWFAHFTSSWPVRRPDRGVIIIKRGENESHRFSLHCSSLWHARTDVMFLFVPAERKAARQRRQDFPMVLFFTLWTVSATSDCDSNFIFLTLTLFSWWLHLWISMMIFKRRNATGFLQKSFSEALSVKPVRDSLSGGSEWLWTLDVNCWSQKRTFKLLQTHTGFLYQNLQLLWGKWHSWCANTWTSTY